MPSSITCDQSNGTPYASLRSRGLIIAFIPLESHLTGLQSRQQGVKSFTGETSKYDQVASYFTLCCLPIIGLRISAYRDINWIWPLTSDREQRVIDAAFCLTFVVPSVLRDDCPFYCAAPFIIFDSDRNIRLH